MFYVFIEFYNLHKFKLIGLINESRSVVKQNLIVFRFIIN